MNRFRTSSGFVMIASLLFLIVLTLLGMSAMGMVGLQQRMATNLKEKERATEVAEVAIRASEVFLAGQSDIPIAGSGPVSNFNNSTDFTLASTWSGVTAHNDPPFNNSTYIGTGLVSGASAKYFAAPQSITEEAAFVPYSLDPDDLALGRGLFYYRVTGRGFGGNVTAQSVVQSMYMQRYR